MNKFESLLFFDHIIVHKTEEKRVDRSPQDKSGQTTFRIVIVGIQRTILEQN